MPIRNSAFNTSRTGLSVVLVIAPKPRRRHRYALHSRAHFPTLLSAPLSGYNDGGNQTKNPPLAKVTQEDRMGARHTFKKHSLPTTERLWLEEAAGPGFPPARI